MSSRKTTPRKKTLRPPSRASSTASSTASSRIQNTAARKPSRRETRPSKPAGPSPAATPPRRVAFCCENSAMLAWEALGDSSLRSSLRESIRIVKVPCAGGVEVRELLHAVESGMEQVLVIGCPLDNCKFIRGNRRTLKRVETARHALKAAGLDENRIRMELISSVDSHKLTAILNGSMTP